MDKKGLGMAVWIAIGVVVLVAIIAVFAMSGGNDSPNTPNTNNGGNSNTGSDDWCKELTQTTPAGKLTIEGWVEYEGETYCKWVTEGVAGTQIQYKKDDGGKDFWIVTLASGGESRMQYINGKQVYLEVNGVEQQI